MKKNYSSAASVARKQERVKLDRNQSYILTDDHHEMIDLVMLANDKGLKVYEDVKRCPIDTEYPFLIWDAGCNHITQSKDDSYTKLSFADAKRLVEYFSPNEVKVELNGEYDATVTETQIIVGCQKFDLSVIKKLIKAQEKVKEVAAKKLKMN